MAVDHGWRTFELKYRFDLRAHAERLATMSPICRHKSKKAAEEALSG